jgi:hypothetical protein
MKRTIILIFGLLIPLLVFTQSPYVLTVRQAEYEELENPVSVNNGEVWNENASFSVMLDYEFPLNDEAVNEIILNPGHGCSFNSDVLYHLLLFHFPFGGSFLLDRGYGTAESLSPLDYEIIGDEGERILKFQWTNAGFVMDMKEDFGWGITNEDYINFQIWFYEEDGMIEIHSGPHSVLNSNSFGLEGDGAKGPWPAFLIDDFMLDIYGSADNPDARWISNGGIVYGEMLDGIPSEGTVYILSPDFSSSIKNQDERKYGISTIWNPSNDELSLRIEAQGYTEGRIEIYSLSGRKVLAKALHENHETINLSCIPKGLYIVNIRIDGKVISKRIIK